ncbi:MAG: PIN domain-containing protein [Defluviitaleaceae bacterium]|nr:PIN domain-containing protein [Defluviitaleaceae bacterium]
MTYALDTNVIIDLLNLEPLPSKRLGEIQKANSAVVILSIVNYEIKKGFNYRPAPKKQAGYAYMRKEFALIEVTEAVWDCAALIWSGLRKKGTTTGDADILIAAFCLVNDYTLVTANTKHFEIIDGLVVDDWTVQ